MFTYCIAKLRYRGWFRNRWKSEGYAKCMFHTWERVSIILTDSRSLSLILFGHVVVAPNFVNYLGVRNSSAEQWLVASGQLSVVG